MVCTSCQISCMHFTQCHLLCVCSSEAAGILKQTLQDPQQVQNVCNAPSSAQNDQARVNLEVEPQHIEDCMDTFLSLTEEFGHLFHQVWQVLDGSDICSVHTMHCAVLALLVSLTFQKSSPGCCFCGQKHSIPCCPLYRWGVPCGCVLFHHPSYPRPSFDSSSASILNLDAGHCFCGQMHSIPCCSLYHWGVPCGCVLFHHPSYPRPSFDSSSASI